ncbi:MAG: SsrA-binding protein SmpB [Desulfococcaceae bacterium]|nr:SsrA-binding protein SmpB [Desulfococcaceae bacterium]
MEKKGIKIVAENRKARFNYSFEDRFEAGLVLKGTEVKSLREGRAHLKDAYAKIQNGELFVHQMHISPYPFAYYDNHDPERPRKLLMHKHEIRRLTGKIVERGYALIPLNIYFKNGKVKITLGLGKGKQRHDKRETIRRRDQQRDMDRARKENYQ